LPVTKISGVGVKTAQLLERSGVRTIGELARFPGAKLKKMLGKNSIWLWAIARGLEELPVEERPDPKSISVERTFDRDVSERSVVASEAAARQRSGRAAELPCRPSIRLSNSRTTRGPSSPAGGPRRCTSGRLRFPSADRGTRNHRRTAPCLRGTDARGRARGRHRDRCPDDSRSGGSGSRPASARPRR